MDSEDIIRMLDHIKDLIKLEETNTAIAFIDKKKLEIILDRDAAKEYIDGLVSNLK